MASFPKGEVVRFVVSDGKPAIDRTGKLNGRGVYLCRSLQCFDLAMKKKRLAHALGISLTPDEAATLREEYAKEISNAEVTE
jgi:predicted RNA-binding protein YlxR (DUF448 family)